MNSMPRRPAWAHALELSVKPNAGVGGISRAIEFLSRVAVPAQPHQLAEYPFDAHLLVLSPLYRKSRSLYAKNGGKFRSTLVSSARTLNSPILLEQTIEYTPIAHEFIWAATDRIERKSFAKFDDLRRFIPSLYHEQNHRILWRMLPPPPKSAAALRRYLNFAESLVITTDMALGDELGSILGSFFTSLGLTYDPGTTVRNVAKNSRVYRNYLQACLHATYLNLEGYKAALIAKVVYALYSNLDPTLITRALNRAAALNRGFITKTNLVWQRKHHKAVIEMLAHKNKTPLTLADDPINNIEQYKIAETWFDTIRL